MFEITHSNFHLKHLPTFLFLFASTLSKFFFAHWKASSLLLYTYSTGISKPYPALRLILPPVTSTLIVWFGKEINLLNVEEYKNGTWPTKRDLVWLKCIIATAFSSCIVLSSRLERSPYMYGNREHKSCVSEPRSCCQSRWEFQKGFPFCLVDHWSSLHFCNSSSWIYFWIKLNNSNRKVRTEIF